MSHTDSNESTALAELSVDTYADPAMIEQCLGSLHLSPQSAEAYRKRLVYFFTWLRDQGLSSFTRDDILRYQRHLEESYSANTTISYLTAIRRFFDIVSLQEDRPNVAYGIHSAMDQRGLVANPVDRERVTAMLEAMPRTLLAEKRDYAIAVLLLETGLSTSELERLDVGDIRGSAESPTIDVAGGRRTRARRVPLDPEAFEALRDYIEALGQVMGPLAEDTPLFVSVSHRNDGKRLTARSISRIRQGLLRQAGLPGPRFL